MNKKMIINETEVTLEGGYYRYFACTCKEEDLMYWDGELNKFFEENPVKMPASSLIMSLEYDHDSTVSSIRADMWFGIVIENKESKFYIQCDLIEHGLLAAIKILTMLEEDNK